MTVPRSIAIAGARLAAHPRSQRMVGEGRGRNAVDDGALLRTAQDEGVDRFLRSGVGQGVEPQVLPVNGTPPVMTRLAPPPRLLRDTTKEVILGTRGEDGG